jgi:CDP-glucose 4,6-dehydratase
VANGSGSLEIMVVEILKTWNQKSVFLTGHTGFKGSWLSLWLGMLGAKVHGYSLAPPTCPSLFEVAKIKELFSSQRRGDVKDFSYLSEALKVTEPEVVFHLAAQPLVRESYADPLETFATNVMGTANLLEAIKGVDSVKAVVIITTDKVYENKEWNYPYREVDRLGGRDPYSASKAACEIVVDSYRQSFFTVSSSQPVAIATARAGNVIGGGDWAKDRLVPDCLKAFEKREPVVLRYPKAVRPWQHVLEPLSGYLKLAEQLCLSDKMPTAWNFGPDFTGDCSVGEIAQKLARLWGEGASVQMNTQENHPHEAGLLRLDITQARTQLPWQPLWSVDEALQVTVEWHQAWLGGENMQNYCQRQIQIYQDSLPTSQKA